MVRDVVVAGGTGEVGRQLLARLAEHPGLRVRALVRRPGLPVSASNLQEEHLDFEDEAACRRSLEGPCDLLLIAVGTTRAKAGSSDAFLAVDRDLPLRLIRTLADVHPQARVGLVSSAGADRPRGLYLQAKAEVEAALAATGLAHAVARPSFLVSDRREFRWAERLVLGLLAPAWLALGRALFPRSRGWWRWAPVHVREVAESLLAAALALEPGERRLLESLDLHPGPVPTWGKP
ncbi:MAG TPA: NAD(P)H-binding protein [Holophagaceae bacterium]